MMKLCKNPRPHSTGVFLVRLENQYYVEKLVHVSNEYLKLCFTSLTSVACQTSRVSWLDNPTSACPDIYSSATGDVVKFFIIRPFQIERLFIGPDRP